MKEDINSREIIHARSLDHRGARQVERQLASHIVQSILTVGRLRGDVDLMRLVQCRCRSEKITFRAGRYHVGGRTKDGDRTPRRSRHALRSSARRWQRRERSRDVQVARRQIRAPAAYKF